VFDGGWRFLRWEGGLTGAFEKGTLVMDSDKSLTAVFEPIPKFTLEAQVFGEGFITGNEGKSYYGGENVKLSLNIKDGWELIHWDIKRLSDEWVLSGISDEWILSGIPDLSTQALESLVAHYDGQTGVETDGESVVSWTPIGANGDSLDDMIIVSTQRGDGAPELITYDGSGKLTFDDTDVGADGRYLEGTLSNAESKELTVFWLGHYKAEAPLPSSLWWDVLFMPIL
jgi:hypothetical protein